uniref:Uncharacterized protein n=1 Tax=Rhizophora mucronata TaxID=61149 RepID=A0A2P2R1P4_RHIMU
MSKIIKNSVIC